MRWSRRWGWRARDSAGFSVLDLMHESLEGIGARPSRLFINLVGTVLGIASLIVTVGLAQTASGQIAQQFDAVTATRVVVQPTTAQAANGRTRAASRIPWDAHKRVADLVGVDSSAVYAKLPEGISVTAVQVYDPAEVATAMPPVVAASSQLLQVVQGKIQTGRFFDAGHERRGDRVVVLGAKAAKKLGINRVSGQPAIFIQDRAYTVIGIIAQLGAREGLLESVIVPAQTARAELDVKTLQALDIRIDIGAGPVVARQAPIALNPNDPQGFKISGPGGESSLRQGVEADINVMFIAIGVVALLGGGIGIANVTLLSVTERTGEIGLRRALGARTKDIAWQFMLESATTGVLGGIIGVSVGVFALMVVCLVQQWTPVLAGWATPAGVLIGALVGLSAGAYPAMKAARVEPVDALRDGR